MNLSKNRLNRIHKETPLWRWVLDYPKPNGDSFATNAGQLIQGWLLLKADWVIKLDQVLVLASWQDEFELCHPLVTERRDVVEHFQHQFPEAATQLRCGFSFSVPRSVKRLFLAVEIDGQRWPISEVLLDSADEPVDVLKVMCGTNGWLFLDNDTNGSVDQFTGRLRLSDAGLDGWRRFLLSCRSLSARASCRFVFLISPSKESVLGEKYHPMRSSGLNPAQQLLLLDEASEVLHPVSALQRIGDEAFIPTDSHWTQRGAMIASLILAEHLGLDIESCKRALENDLYRLRSFCGDLGEKLDPPQFSDVSFLISYDFSRYKTYDNGLPNFGRVIVMEYPEAVSDGICLIFGASSTYSMLNYLTRFFKRVVFIHSAGGLDPCITALVKPNFLVAQTNARFVIQVPDSDIATERLIRRKMAELSDVELGAVLRRQLPATESYLLEVGIAGCQSALK